MDEQNPDQQFTNPPHILKEINITTQSFGIASPNQTADKCTFLNIDATSSSEFGWLGLGAQTLQTLLNYIWLWHYQRYINWLEKGNCTYENLCPSLEFDDTYQSSHSMEKDVIKL